MARYKTPISFLHLPMERSLGSLIYFESGVNGERCSPSVWYLNFFITNSRHVAKLILLFSSRMYVHHQHPRIFL